jgi:hypothetical protein
MLEQRYARYLAAPANAVDAVKAKVASQGGFVSCRPHGHGIAEGLKYFLESDGT